MSTLANYRHRAERYRPTDPAAIAGEIRRQSAAGLKPRDIAAAMGVHTETIFDALRDTVARTTPPRKEQSNG